MDNMCVHSFLPKYGKSNVLQKDGIFSDQHDSKVTATAVSDEKAKYI